MVPVTDTRTRAAAALSLLCAGLAVRDDDPDRLAARLASDTIDWPQVAWLAGNHRVTPALAGALRRKGLFDRLPDEVQDYLDAIQTLNRERNQTLREQLTVVAETLNRMGIQPVLLKGAIALAPNAYPGAEDRVLGDLDLLVPAARWAEATAAIVRLGYREGVEHWQWMLPAERRRRHHGAPLLHPELPVTIELHWWPLRQADDNARLMDTLTPRPVKLAGEARVLIPDPLTRLRHNLLHAQIADRQRRRRRLNVRQLLEFSAIAWRYRDQVDSARLLAGLHPCRHRVLAEYWAQAEHWLGLPYPETLPRSPWQGRELWLSARVATAARWYWLLTGYDLLCETPGRAGELLHRLVVMPGYFPMQLSRCLGKAWRR